MSKILFDFMSFGGTLPRYFSTKNPKLFKDFGFLCILGLIYQSVISLNPEPVSAILFLPVKSEQNIALPVGIELPTKDDCISV